MDFFADKNADLDLGKLHMRLKKGASNKHGYENQRMRQARSEAGCVSLTVFTTQKDQFSRVGCIPKDTRDRGTQVQEGTQTPPVFDLKEVEPWMVRTTGTVRIAPRVKQRVVGRIETPKRRLSPQLVWVESAQLPLEGILVARGLSLYLRRSKLVSCETQRPQ